MLLSSMGSILCSVAAVRKARWILAAALLLPPSSAVAHADSDPDPHIPNANANWCPGGGTGFPPSFGVGHCDGTKYPDGSYWRTVLWQPPTVNLEPGFWPIFDQTDGLHCVVDNGSPDPSPAPPGGCDGAVK